MYLKAGIDEAGRGCIAGAVVAGAVILPKSFPVKILADSKKLTPKKREEIFEIIKSKTTWAAGSASNKEVDKYGIKKATHLAMKRAVRKLSKIPNKLLIDGNDNFEFDIKSEYFIKGDSYIPEIQAASIVAKVTRDREMIRLAKKYPKYQFKKHKGYCTKKHVELVKKHGACQIHRKTFEPVKSITNKNYKIRQIKKGEESELYKLIKPIFDKHVAPSFSVEGIKEFLKVIKQDDVKERLKQSNRKILFAEDINTSELIGMIKFKNFNHISLFFVKSKLQKYGIGKMLFKRCLNICKRNNKNLKKITVNSSPNAVEIYKKVGFQEIEKGKIQEKNGIKFVKMKYLI